MKEKYHSIIHKYTNYGKQLIIISLVFLSSRGLILDSLVSLENMSKEGVLMFLLLLRNFPRISTGISTHSTCLGHTSKDPSLLLAFRELDVWENRKTNKKKNPIARL